jgi:hypothetical protein
MLMEKFISGDYDKIELIYNQFKMPQRKLFKRSNSYHWQQYNQIWQLRLEIIFWTVQRRDYHDIDSKIVEDTIVQSDQRFIRFWTRCSYDCYAKATDNATDLRRVEIDLQ